MFLMLRNLCTANKLITYSVNIKLGKQIYLSLCFDGYQKKVCSTQLIECNNFISMLYYHDSTKYLQKVMFQDC